MKNPQRPPRSRLSLVDPPGRPRGGYSDPRLDPARFLAIPRADLQACAAELSVMAAQLGADRPISQQEREHRPTGDGFSLEEERRLARVMVGALADVPSAARLAGLTGAELQAVVTTSLEAGYLGGHAEHLSRGTSEAGFVLGHAALSVIEKTCVGLAQLIAQAEERGAPLSEIAALRADHERLAAPLAAAEQRREARARATRARTTELEEAERDAADQARYEAILDVVRAGEHAILAPEDILWAAARLHGAGAAAAAGAPAAASPGAPAAGRAPAGAKASNDSPSRRRSSSARRSKGR